MADLIIPSKKQSLLEIRQWDVDFTSDLPTGVTVESATATHIPPSGQASVPVIGTIAESVVPVQIGPLSVIGNHFLSVLATYSNGEKSEVRLMIAVDY